MHKIVSRDRERFSKLYPEPRAILPKKYSAEDYSAELEIIPIRVLIRQSAEQREKK